MPGGTGLHQSPVTACSTKSVFKTMVLCCRCLGELVCVRTQRQPVLPVVCLKPWFYVVGAWGNWSSSEPSDSLLYQECAALGSEFDRYFLVDQECSTQLGYICDIRESRLLSIRVFLKKTTFTSSSRIMYGRTK